VRHDLVLNNDKKIVFLILDGVGDIPNPQLSHLMPLEAAMKPNIDRLAVESGIHEHNCVTGSIGTIYSEQLMPLVLAHGLKLDKYGA
jgi:2,3-bisphosphoglycerate-independent phosphoglycerate mutase